MVKKCYASIFLYFLVLVWDIKEVNVQKTYSSPTRTTRYGDQLQSRTKPPEYSEQLKTLPRYDSRIPATTKPRCRTTRCNTNKSDRRRLETPTATTKSASVKYKALKLSALSKNDTKSDKFPRKAKFSRMLDTVRTDEDSGFVPIANPQVLKKSPRSSQRRARHKATEDLVVKESRPNPTSILGNGNFEILSGGVYSEDESNEIPEGRRMSRGYETYAVPHRFHPIPFNARNFQFPSFYQDRHQLPTHPMFFPRAAY